MEETGPQDNMEAQKSEISDKEVIKSVLDGDKASFEILVGRYSKRLLAYMLGKVGNAHTAEDLSQEVLIRAYQYLSTCQNPDSFSTWVFGIAKNTLRNWFRDKKGLEIPLEKLEVSYETDILNQEQRLNALQHEVNSLPSNLRDILRLKYQDGKTCREIAALTGKPLNTVMVTLYRTYRKLHARLKEEV